MMDGAIMTSNLSIKSTNPNYLARVIKLPAPRKHTGADRLQCVSILGNNVITGLNAKEGDLYVYFPLESAINIAFLSHTNSFSNAEDNRDKKIKGFFSKQGRVKALKLRNEKSEGYIVPAASINEWIGREVITVNDVDQDFDTIGGDIDQDGGTTGGILLCEKYVNRQTLIDEENAARQKKIKGKKARESKVIEGQYYLAADTEHLKRNSYKISPDDQITISYKMHGCNFSAGNVLCKKKLKWYEKVLKKLGVNIVDTHYDVLYASRRVMKNSKYADKEYEHYYDVDIWGSICEKYKNSLQKGITIHGEICGQLPNGKWIQKPYSYSLSPTTADLFVYRIFSINADGKVFEFDTAQIVDYCLKNGLKTVPIFYTGKAKDLFPELELGEHWNANFLAKLIEKYTEKDCYLCGPGVPEEGICLTKNSGNSFDVFKLKSFRFLQQTSELNDANYVDIDDVN